MRHVVHNANSSNTLTTTSIHVNPRQLDVGLLSFEPVKTLCPLKLISTGLLLSNRINASVDLVGSGVDNANERRKEGTKKESPCSL
jgi:hypothetical protein